MSEKAAMGRGLESYPLLFLHAAVGLVMCFEAPLSVFGICKVFALLYFLPGKEHLC